MIKKVAFEFVLADEGRWGVFEIGLSGQNLHESPSINDLLKTGNAEQVTKFVNKKLIALEHLKPEDKS